MSKIDAASSILVAAIEGVDLTPEERDFFLSEQPAGITLFARNISYPLEKTKKFLADFQSLSTTGLPFIVAIDQEGGRVRRIRESFPDQISMMELTGGKDDPSALEEIEDHGAKIGGLLLDVGVNVNFAPVLDVLTESKNVGIGDRAFGTDPVSVAKRASAFLTGMQGAGLLGCLKHFPGQGDAGADTHHGPATIDKTIEELEECELVPFQEMLGDASLVMISHCQYTAFDEMPASLSPIVISYLRRELGFAGIVVSDDFNMHAIQQDASSWTQALIESVMAGTDMLLVCRGLDKFKLALEALRAEAESNPVFSDRLNDAASRVEKLRSSLSS